jgi:hypothetical protein
LESIGHAGAPIDIGALSSGTFFNGSAVVIDSYFGFWFIPTLSHDIDLRQIFSIKTYTLFALRTRFF